MSVPKPTCVVCKKQVVIRTTFSTMRDDDATWSVAMQGWVCFECQCEPVRSVEFDDEKTDPNFNPDWPPELEASLRK